MIQSGLKQEQKQKITQIKVKTSGQNKWIQKIVPLKYNSIFIYYDGGSYEMYDVDKQKITFQGKLPDEILFFLEIYTKVLIFHDPTDLQMKLLDLNSNQINPKFVFRSSDQIDIKSDKNSREIIADKFRVFFLDCKEKQIKYLISQDLEKHYSENNVCHYLIRVLPLNYDSEKDFELQPVIKYDYPNSTAQEKLFYWQVDKETIAVYGQENINQKSEILFIKPHLMEKAFYIVHTEYQCSYLTMNVSNWVIPHQVAIWVNNDNNARPSIFTIDLRNYYDGKNWLPEPEFTATLVRDQYIGDDPETFMDIYQFYLDSTYVIQFRLVGVVPKISIINYQNIQKPEIVSEFQVDSFFHEIAVDHSYILFYNDLDIDNQIVKFSQLIHIIDTKNQLLKILEKAKIIEKYGIHVVEELFEFYY